MQDIRSAGNIFFRGRRAIAAALVLLAPVLTGLPCFGAADEFRAFWVDTWGQGVKNKGEVEALLGRPGNPTIRGTIRDANFNAVIVEVRRRSDVCYPSAMGEPYFSGLSPADYNALADIIAAAHDTTGGKQRIEVHCWIVAFATSNNAVPPPNSVYWRHNDPADSDNYWLTLDSSGNETGDRAFDPGHPKVLEYLTGVCMDLVNNFDIDGLHYDYIRFTGSAEGYNPVSVARYNKRYGLTGKPDPASEQFKQWRRDQVTALVRKVYANIQASKPWVKQSAALITGTAPGSSTRAAFQATYPYTSIYSDWDAWLSEGILDMAIPMAYFDQSTESANYAGWMNFTRDRKANRHAIIGPSPYRNTLQDALTQIAMTREASPAGNYAQGFSCYSYKALPSGTSWADFSAALVAQVTQEPAAVPLMPWKTAPTAGHTMGTVTTYPDVAWADGALVTALGASTGTYRSIRCDGTGFYAFIDLPPDIYTINVSLEGVRSKRAEVVVTAGSMSEQDFLLGDDSPPVISGVSVSDIGDSQATVSWKTDKPSDSLVEYGVGDLSQSTALDSALVTSHSATLTGLTSNTLYQFRVVSSCADGTRKSDICTFTSSGIPQVSGVAVSEVAAVSATITWVTNAPASSQVKYGATAGYGSESLLSQDLVTAHRVVLNGLTPDTQYHFRVESANPYGRAESADAVLRTFGAPKISNLVAVPEVFGAKITWETDCVSDSQVEFGPTSAYGLTSPLEAAGVVSHSVQLSGLTYSTTYHFRVRSANEAGAGYSPDFSFTTSPFGREVVVDNSDQAFEYVKGGAWAAGTSSIKFGETYFFAKGVDGTSENSATHVARWTPDIPVSGFWDIHVFYARGQNRTTNSFWKISRSGGTDVVRVNQQAGGNGWQLLASGVPMRPDNGAYIELANNTGEADKYIQGDAVRLTYIRGDIMPPSVPANGAATATGVDSISLAWAPSTDDHSLSGYRIYRDSELVGSASGNSYADSSGLAPNTTYSYGITAVDLAGNESAMSAPVSGVTLSVAPGPDTITCNRAPEVWYSSNGFVFNAVGGFGTGRLTRCRAAWTRSADHIWGEPGEIDWQAGSLLKNAAAGNAWYLHLKGYNSAGIANGEYHAGPFRYDPTPPAIESVDDGQYALPASGISARWAGADNESGIRNYELSVGSLPGETGIRGWTDVGQSTAADIVGLAFRPGDSCFVNVRATNNAGSVGSVVSSAGLTVVLPVARIGDAKGHADGTAIGLDPRPATAAFGDAVYIEDPDGSSGIRVEGVSGVAAGEVVRVFGRLGVKDGCERHLYDCKMLPADQLPMPRVQIVRLASLGGDRFGDFTPAGFTGAAGLNNVGLLVASTGRVSAVYADGFALSDGSSISDSMGNPGVRVCTGCSPRVAVGQWVSATGICSATSVQGSTYPVILSTQLLLID